jgi:asparagine synthase (glutamine-hydrolysing)
MCGFAGYVDNGRRLDAQESSSLVRRMADMVAHRGPDDWGEWVDEKAGLALGHRRLSIIDLSPDGHQPMISACGRYVIVFNGEIYNYQEIRKNIDKSDWSYPWRGHSDTEVLLAAVSMWGVEKALDQSNGMFALAVWDRRERTLVLARDRLGEKPVYFGWCGDVFLFASELKALRVHPAWRTDIDRNALSIYLRYNYVPAPYSIYKGIYKLPPGTWMELKHNGKGTYVVGEPREYWSPRKAVDTGISIPFRGTEREAEDALDALLKDAVKARMYADVSLGAFLSGGIDSSAIVSLMQTQSSRPVKTFTIGFNEQDYNEAADAKAVANHLGTDHTELYVTPQEALDVIPMLPKLYDEPFADASQIPTFLVSRLARSQVTVALSGDGGDELFGGYNRHFWVERLWRRIRYLPLPVRNTIATALTAVAPEAWDSLFVRFARLLPGWAVQRTPGYKLHKLAGALSARSPEDMYNIFTSHWKRPEKVVISGSDQISFTHDVFPKQLTAERVSERMMYLDLVTYLPDDILVKVDRATMGVSLEARVPYLDHRVVEFAWSIPMSMKIRGGQGKRILRHVLDRYVPPVLIDRPKTGFSIPIDRWLRGPLREWAEGLLEESRLRREGFFDPVSVRSKWTEHLSGKRDWQYHLWDILMFQAWLENS